MKPPPPVTSVGPTVNVPFPLPSKTTELLGRAVTRSSLPSPLKSPVAITYAPPETATILGDWNVPFPLPSSTAMLLAAELLEARSGLPSPLKSPVQM